MLECLDLKSKTSSENFAFTVDKSYLPVKQGHAILSQKEDKRILVQKFSRIAIKMTLWSKNLPYLTPVGKKPMVPANYQTKKRLKYKDLGEEMDLTFLVNSLLLFILQPLVKHPAISGGNSKTLNFLWAGNQSDH